MYIWINTAQMFSSVAGVFYWSYTDSYNLSDNIVFCVFSRFACGYEVDFQLQLLRKGIRVCVRTHMLYARTLALSGIDIF